MWLFKGLFADLLPIGRESLRGTIWNLWPDLHRSQNNSALLSKISSNSDPFAREGDEYFWCDSRPEYGILGEFAAKLLFHTCMQKGIENKGQKLQPYCQFY